VSTPHDAKQRRAAVLKVIVEEYVRSAQPVASAAVVRKMRLRVSSATVRNDMVALEDAGLITQPHASAGRVPSSQGYRQFVDELMGPARVPPSEQRTILHQFHQIEGQAAESLALGLTLLSRMVETVAVVTEPRRRGIRVRDVHLSRAGPNRAQLVIMLEGGLVASSVVAIEPDPERWLLQRMSSRLGAMLAGKTARQIEALRSTLEASEAQVVEVIVELMHSLEGKAVASQRFAGVGALLRQPEFRDVGRVHPLLAMLEDGTLVSRLRQSLPGAPGVRVVIAGERTLDVVDEYSAVLARYGDDARGHGVVGIVGPQRLPYRRAVASVEVIARALSRVGAVAAA
jgi:heat-inducible transcriptional repressor